MSSFHRRVDAFPLYVAVGGLAVAAYVWRLWLLPVRGFDPDEFEHLHGAWEISLGFLPYRDYFEHHTPLLHFFLAPWFRFFHVETRVGDAIEFLFFARRWMWVFTGAILTLTFLIGRTWRDARTGAVGTFFLAFTLMFLWKTLEVRPDLLSVSFWLLCVLLTIRAIRSPKPEVLFAFAGAALALAILSSQKLLFAGPGYAVTTLWYLAGPRRGRDLRARFRGVVALVVGFAAPMLLMAAYFALRGGLGAFIEYNLLWNLRWKLHFSPRDHIERLIRENPALVAFGVVGCLRAVAGMFRREAVRRGDDVLPVNLVGLVVGLFLMPVPYTQYYQSFLPLLALCAGALLVEGTDVLFRLRDRRPTRAGLLFGILFGVLAVAAFQYTLRQALPSIRELLPGDYLALWGAVFIAVVLFWFVRLPGFALALVLVLWSAYPWQQMAQSFRWRNTGQLDEIRYVLEHTSPADTVMDGWTGRGVFRPHAYFFFFLHPEIRAMLPEGERERLLARLKSGEIAPRLILFDGNLQGLSPEITAFFSSHYEPVGKGVIWQRKGSAP